MVGSVAVSGAALPHIGASRARNCNASRRFAADVCRVTLREREERERKQGTETESDRRKKRETFRAQREGFFAALRFLGLGWGLGGFKRFFLEKQKTKKPPTNRTRLHFSDPLSISDNGSPRPPLTVTASFQNPIPLQDSSFFPHCPS